jgi:CRP-like cAMP-binding protein
MDSLKKNILSIVGHNPPFLEKVVESFDMIKLHRNDCVLKSGDYCKYVYFIESGLIEIYTEGSDCNEKTLDLITSNGWYTDLMSFRNNLPSNVNVIARKPSILYRISKPSFDELMRQVPQFSSAYFTILETKYNDSLSRIVAFNTLTAKERIKWLKNFKPEFLSSIPDKYIASYLGISKETYCRIKRANKIA